MGDANVSFISIQPSQSVKKSNQQAPGGKAVPHVGSGMKNGLYAQRRKKACTAR
jgi:hypothetical protein